MLEVRVLGPLEVVLDGEPVPLGSRSQRRVVAALVAGGGLAGRGRLIDAVWPEEPPPSAERTVQSLISRLRSVLGGDRISTRAHGWELHADLVDAEELERLVSLARAAPGPDAITSYEAALACWRGPPYEELADEPFVQAEARRLTELRLAARTELADALVTVGGTAASVALLEMVVGEEPLHEAAWTSLVQALVSDGRSAAALRAAQRCRNELAAVGLEPSVALERAERLALQPEGGATGPPPTSPQGPTPPTGLPPVRSELVGRRREGNDIATLLGPGRCVTLVGPGGVGKSRLAIEAARRALGKATVRTVAFCDLAAVHRADSVLPALAVCVGAVMTAPLEERIASRCRGAGLLAVVDNCEHVIDEAARVVSRVLDLVDDLTVVATSREPLRVDGEHVVVLEPLPAADAEALYSLRSAAAGRPADEPAAVAELCRRLDHLPLAIEMAAGWARSLTAAEMVARLGDQVPLRSAHRGTGARHRTLEAALRWSYELLPEAERQAFERFSVVAGAVDLDSAADVVGPGRPAIETSRTLLALVDRSLLVMEHVGAVSRLRMLETTRSFAAGMLRLRGDEEGAVADHARWAARWSEQAAEGMRGPETALWAERVSALLPDLRAAVHRSVDGGDLEPALRITAALSLFVYLRLQVDVAGWAQQTVDAARRAGVAVPDDAVACGTMGLLQAGETVLARTALEGVGGSLAAALRSDAALFSGDLGEAIDEGLRAAEEARTEGDRVIEALGLWNVALGRGYGGEVDAALEGVETLRRLARSTACPLLESWADFTEGEFLAERDPERAVTLLARSRDGARALGADVVEGVALVSLTTLRARHGDPRAAVTDLEVAIRHWQRQGTWTHQVVTLRNLVVLFERLGHDVAAATLLGAVERHRPAFGTDAERLAPIRDRLGERLGPRAEALVAEGSRLDPAAAVDLALEAIATTTARR